MADDHPSNQLESREPAVEDLRDLCRELNQRGAKYVVVGAARDVVVHTVDDVPIPFASPRLLWRMKAVTSRAKDAPDLVFLRQWFAQRGEEPPTV